MSGRRYSDCPFGGVAQLVERYVRNVEVGGSSPLTSTLVMSRDCEVPVPGRHSGFGSLATLSGRGSGTWATVAPVPGRHLIRAGRARWFLAVDDHVRNQEGARRAGGAGARGTAL